MAIQWFFIIILEKVACINADTDLCDPTNLSHQIFLIYGILNYFMNEEKIIKE